MTFLHLLSIVMEFAIFVLALKMVFEKKRYLGVPIAVTFGIYVFYDLAIAEHWGVTRGFLDAIFFIATACALYVVWTLGRKRA
jgi:hypothetical protein